jgi:hypothetical protein
VVAPSARFRRVDHADHGAQHDGRYGNAEAEAAPVVGIGVGHKHCVDVKAMCQIRLYTVMRPQGWQLHVAPVVGHGVPDEEAVLAVVEEGKTTVAVEYEPPSAAVEDEPPVAARRFCEEKRSAEMRSGGLPAPMKRPPTRGLLWNTPRTGAWRPAWRVQYRRRKWGSATRARQCLQTTEARRRRNGCGGRRMRISQRT